MSSNDGHIPVLDVDQVFPVLTTDPASRGGSGTAAGQDQAGTVAAALRTVLGWRPRAQDTTAFAAALRASFRLTEAEGHTISTYVPRGIAVQADLGSISGGQASLYSRARMAADQATTLLDSLTPLRIDYDPQDGEAFRTLVRHGVARLVEELGNLGGPRQAIVDGVFDVLLGRIPTTGPGSLSMLPAYTPDTVPGQLGALRDRFGLIDENVNTVDEEALRTSFWTLVDLVLDLRRAWEAQKREIGSGSGSGFLGTDLVVVNRLLAAAAEQVDELEAVLDSALVGTAERQTVVLGRDSGLTLDGLLAWTRRFLTEDGPLYLRDTGRDGIRTAFAPMAQQLVTTVRRNLVDRLGGPARPAQPAGQTTGMGTGMGAAQPDEPVAWIPVGGAPRFPSGMYAARTRIAVSGLSRLLENLFTTSARISRFPGIVLFDVQFTVLEDTSPPTNTVVGQSDVAAVRVDVRGANLRPTYLPALRGPVIGKDDQVSTATRLLLPIGGSETADDDTLTAVFFMSDSLRSLLSSLSVDLSGGPRSVLVPAQSVPVEVIDGESGQVVHAPPVVDWPGNRPSPRTVVTDPIAWDEYPDQAFGGGAPGGGAGGQGAANRGPGRPALLRPDPDDPGLIDEHEDDGHEDDGHEDDDVPRVPRARVGNGGTRRGAAPDDDTGDPPDGAPARRAPRGRGTGPDGDRAGVTAVLERDQEQDDGAADTDTAPRRRPAKRAQRGEPARERAPRKQAPRKRAARGAAQQGTPAAGAGGDEEGPPGDRREQPGGADTDGS